MPGFYELPKQSSWMFLPAALPLPCNTLLQTLSKVRAGIKSSLVFSSHLSFLKDVDPGIHITLVHPTLVQCTGFPAKGMIGSLQVEGQKQTQKYVL